MLEGLKVAVQDAALMRMMHGDGRMAGQRGPCGPGAAHVGAKSASRGVEAGPPRIKLHGEVEKPLVLAHLVEPAAIAR